MSFNENIVYSKSSLYQRIVLTRNKRELRLFLNGNLQFSSADEYRYHEALVHPALSSVADLRDVLVLGGGDGMAVREILKYPGVRNITLVDLDKEMTGLFSSQEMLMRLNKSSLVDKRVQVVNGDAFMWLRTQKQTWDAIVIDFPDPSSFSIGKLYSTLFYNLVRNKLRPNGIAVVQSTSPYVAPKSFWCIDTTLRSVGLYTRPYHNYVPSFGEWGYIMASKEPVKQWFTGLPPALRYLNMQTLTQMFVFPEDMKSKSPPDINKLNNQSLVNYFEEEWGNYLE